MLTFNSVCVLGLGYIGLPTAAVLASRNIAVIGVDVNHEVVDTINQGNVHIVEPDLDIVVHAAVTEGRLRATSTVEPADAFIIAVPTPLRGERREPDMSYVMAASEAVASVLQPGNLVVLESTSPVGATEEITRRMASERPDLSFPNTHGERSDIRVAYCPERVLPGRVMEELISNDRVIGGMTRRCAEVAADLYKTFVRGECVIASTTRVAEMSKLTENSFRDVNVAFANELSIVCDQLGVDVWELIELANRHPRVNVLQPGPGVGGHCLAVDPWFIVSAVPKHAQLIRVAREVNDGKPEWVLQKIESSVRQLEAADPGKSRQQISIALYGLAFKPDIDDLRESPAVIIARRLVESHPGKVMIVEPYIETLPEELAGHAELVQLDKAKEADVHVLLVDHMVFRALDKPSGVIVDTRGVWS